MIVGLGIDAIEIDRFSNYSTRKNLQRLFHPEEIIYCLSNPSKSAERFALRFAAKEAFFKALTQANGGTPPCPFLTLCSITCIIASPAPTIYIKSDTTPIPIFNECTSIITLTHTKKIAVAQVILQKI